MKFKELKIIGAYEILLEPKKDDRGYFMRTFSQDEFDKLEMQFSIVQINRSFNRKKGTIRGMHYQEEPKAEDKIVQVLQGKIYDVILDLRTESKTYKKWIGIELSANNNKMVFIPKGCAHGFQTLTDNCELEYFMSQYYSPKHAKVVKWDNERLKIFWPLVPTLVSERDKVVRK